MTTTNKLIIGISGRKGSGKDTLANQIIVEWLARLNITAGVDKTGCLFLSTKAMMTDLSSGNPALVHDYARNYAATKGARVIGFADPIKRFCMEVFGLSYEQCYGSDREKNTPTEIRWPDSDVPMMAREVMQYFGTNLMRGWMNDMWVRPCLREIVACLHPVVIVTDVRFPDEAGALKAIGAKLIRLLRDPYGDKHVSESALDNFPPEFWDMVVPANLHGVEVQGDHVRSTIVSWVTDLMDYISGVAAEPLEKGSLVVLDENDRTVHMK